MILEHIPGSTFEKFSLPVVHVHPCFTQFFRQGHPFKELDLNPAAVYTKKRRTQRCCLDWKQLYPTSCNWGMWLHTATWCPSLLCPSQKNDFQRDTVRGFGNRNAAWVSHRLVELLPPWYMFGCLGLALPMVISATESDLLSHLPRFLRFSSATLGGFPKVWVSPVVTRIFNTKSVMIVMVIRDGWGTMTSQTGEVSNEWRGQPSCPLEQISLELRARGVIGRSWFKRVYVYV